MKKFMAVFTGSAAGMAKWEKLDEKTRKERERQGMAAWHGWVEKNKKAITEMGSPLGKTKRVDGNGVSDMKNELTAFTVVQAETHEEAAKLFLNHPHFAIFPGDHIEIMECLPIPGM
jgi:hypothetical protein